MSQNPPVAKRPRRACRLRRSMRPSRCHWFSLVPIRHPMRWRPDPDARPQTMEYQLKAVLLASATALALGGCTTMTQDTAPVETTATAEAPPAMPDNILLAEWAGPYDGVPPFDQVTQIGRAHV